MADKTIPDLNPISTINENALFIVDTGTETFRMTSANLALFVAATILPAGLLMPFVGAVAPSGWLLADGSNVSRTTYARLFATIGTTYGIGDGVETFGLPDMRGRVAAGKDDMGGSAASRITTALSGINGAALGAAGGLESRTPTGTIGGSQSIAHTHTVASHTHTMAHTHSVTSNVTVATQPTFTHSHTHSVASHHHTMAHVHGMFYESAGGDMYANETEDTSSTANGTGDTKFLDNSSVYGSGVVAAYGASSGGDKQYYTTGVSDSLGGFGGGFPLTGDTTLSTGSASTSATTRTADVALTNSAVTSGAASVSTTSAGGTGVTGAMSANATVNGVNFTFTGAAASSVQPTLITNYIIRT